MFFLSDILSQNQVRPHLIQLAHLTLFWQHMLYKTFFLRSLLPSILPFDSCCIILKLEDLTISNWFWEPVVRLTEGSREWAYLAIFLNSSLWDENSSLAHTVLNKRAISDLLAFWFSSLVCTCLTGISIACALMGQFHLTSLFHFYQSFPFNREMLCRKSSNQSFPELCERNHPEISFFHDIQVNVLGSIFFLFKGKFGWG